VGDVVLGFFAICYVKIGIVHNDIVRKATCMRLCTNQWKGKWVLCTWAQI